MHVKNSGLHDPAEFGKKGVAGHPHPGCEISPKTPG